MKPEKIKVFLTDLIGKDTLSGLIFKRKRAYISPELIRKMFMSKVKQRIYISTPAQLAKICTYGSGFSEYPYENRSLITYPAVNVHFAVYLNIERDSGLVQLQKIATATLLQTLILIINDGLPFETGTSKWYIEQLLTKEEITAIELLNIEMEKKLGW